METETTTGYRNCECSKCGRIRVLACGVCEKCNWDNDSGEYAGIPILDNRPIGEAGDKLENA